MAKFWTCKYGANHGVGERCDCEKEMETEREVARKMAEKTERILAVESSTGQLAFKWPTAKKVGA